MTDNQTFDKTSGESQVYPCIHTAFLGFPLSFLFGGGNGSCVIIRAGATSAVCELVVPPESTASEQLAQES